MATAAIYDLTAERQLRSNRMENQKSGFVPMYRSILKQSWRKDVYLRTLWQDLLFSAQKEPRKVNFKGRDWLLNTGQLVTTFEDIGANLCNRENEPTTRHSVKRMLDVFVKEGMIQYATEHRKGTVITLLNYSEYNQKLADLPAPNLAPYPAHNKPSDSNGSNGYAAHNAARYPAPHEQQCNNNNINTSSENSDESSDKASKNTPVLRDGAAIQSDSGAKWGTDHDLKTAEWMFSRVRKVSPTAKQPTWASWANDIRLMRDALDIEHQEICRVFNWANKDQFWQTNVLSPSKLRKQWDTLSAKMLQQPNHSSSHSAAKPEPHWNSAESWEDVI